MFFNIKWKTVLFHLGSLFSGWFEINLDKRKLKTPNGKVFRVPSEPLALAVATEWNAQDKLVKRHSMHLVCIYFFPFRFLR